MPRVKPGPKGPRRLPQYILEYIWEKRRLRGIIDRTGDPGRRITLKANMRNLDQIIKGAIANFEQAEKTARASDLEH